MSQAILEEQRRAEKLTGNVQIDVKLLTHESAKWFVDPDERPNIHDRQIWVFGLISEEN